MAQTNGFNGGIADVVVMGNLFTDYVTGNTTPSTCIFIPTNGGEEGGIVYEDSAGSVRWWPYAYIGYNPIHARRVLASATVNGTPRTTTASPLYWYGGVVGA